MPPRPMNRGKRRPCFAWLGGTLVPDEGWHPDGHCPRVWMWPHDRNDSLDRDVIAAWQHPRGLEVSRFLMKSYVLHMNGRGITSQED